MKKQTLMLVAGGLMTLAACNNQATTEPSQAMIDSLANARLEELKLEWAAKNDSIINSLAQMKADSMLATMKGGKTTATTKTNTSRTNTGTANTTVTSPDDNKTTDGRLNTKGKDNDGRLDVNKSKDNKKNDGRLDINK